MVPKVHVAYDPPCLFLLRYPRDFFVVHCGVLTGSLYTSIDVSIQGAWMTSYLRPLNRYLASIHALPLSRSKETVSLHAS